MGFQNLLRDDSFDNERGAAQSSQSQRRSKRKRQSFVSPSLILKVFPEIDPDVLCRLSELDPPTPSNVLALVPGASSKEIARFFDLLSGSTHQSPTVERRSVSKQPASVAGSLVDEIKCNLEDNCNDR